MPLAKLRKLTKGFVLELDGNTQKPAEVFVRGRLVARGEVVVVNGNYGVRITEVASQAERIQISRMDTSVQWSAMSQSRTTADEYRSRYAILCGIQSSIPTDRLGEGPGSWCGVGKQKWRSQYKL